MKLIIEGNDKKVKALAKELSFKLKRFNLTCEVVEEEISEAKEEVKKEKSKRGRKSKKVESDK